MSQDSPRNAGASASTLEQTVDRAQARLVELARLQQTARTQLVCLITAICAMFILFMWGTYAKLKENFNPNAVTVAMSNRAVQLAPQAAGRLRGAATAAMPVYRELAMQRFQKISPQLAQDAVARMKTVPNSAGVIMTDRLRVVFDNVLKKIQPEVEATFPTLDKDKQNTILTDFRDRMIAEENDKMKRHVAGLYAKELVRLQDALTRFDHTVPVNADADTLSRKFLRGLIRYVDHLIVVGGEEHQRELIGPPPRIISMKASAVSEPAAAKAAGAPEASPRQATAVEATPATQPEAATPNAAAASNAPTTAPGETVDNQ